MTHVPWFSRAAVLTATAAVAIFGAGCATHLAITSDPADAALYAKGVGRAAYRWRYIGHAPMAYDSRYAHEVGVAVWADGTQSDPVDLPGGWGEKADVRFVKPAAPARPANAAPATGAVSRLPAVPLPPGSGNP